MLLNPGSRVRTGSAFNWSDLGYDPVASGNEAELVDITRANLLNFLYDGVTFSDVRVTVEPPGWFADGYITVEATTKTQLPNAETFGDMIAYALAQYLPIVQVMRRDATRIDYAAPAPRPTPSPTPTTSPSDTGYIPVVGEPPRTPYTPPTPQKAKSVSPMVWLGLGLLAIVAVSLRD